MAVKDAVARAICAHEAQDPIPWDGLTEHWKDVYRAMAVAGPWVKSYQYPTIADVRANLAGRDIACWCPLEDEETGQPIRCHADVLLVVAAGGDPWDRPNGWPHPEEGDR